MVLPASVWVEVELPAVEVDRGLEVLAVAEAAGGVADPLDRRVEPLGGGVGDAVAQVREHVREMGLEHPGLLDHRRQPGVRRPEVPAAEEFAGGADVAILPQVGRRFLGQVPLVLEIPEVDSPLDPSSRATCSARVVAPISVKSRCAWVSSRRRAAWSPVSRASSARAMWTSGSWVLA